MNRAEHLEWAKERALAELGPDGGGVTTAIASIQSDLRKHPELESHRGLDLMMIRAVAGDMNTERDVREFVEGLL